MNGLKIYFFGLSLLVMVLGGNVFLCVAGETSSMMCDGGVVNIGDADVEVRENCGEPDTQGVNRWVYNFETGESYTVIFENGKVVRILEID